MSRAFPHSATALALEIPEILELIASHISSKHDLMTCTLVCRTWNERFSPCLYRYLRLPASPNTFAGAVRHATHLRRLLLFRGVYASLFPLPFNRLTTLNVRHRGLPGPEFFLLPDFIRQNNITLQEFMVCYMDSFAPTLWEAISTCSKLEKIRLHRCIARGSDMNKFVDAIKNVRILHITHANIDFSEVKSPFVTTSPPRLPNLQHLDILRPVNFSGNIGPLVQHAPNLISLKLDPQLNSEPASHIRELAVSLRGCQKLQDISFYSMMLSSEESTMILDAITDAKQLNWKEAEFSQQALRSLISRHARTITHLRLSKSPGFTSSMTQTIMTNCPLLESLSLETILGTDLVRIETVDHGNQSDSGDVERVIIGEDWICLGLKTLNLRFDLSSKEMDIDRDTIKGEAMFQRQQQLEQYHAFRQLGRLIHLRNLCISGPSDNTIFERTLDLRLGANGGGLEGLTALKELQSFEFHYMKQELSKGEIDWMFSQWPSLCRMRGTYHLDAARNNELDDYVGDRRMWESICEFSIR